VLNPIELIFVKDDIRNNPRHYDQKRRYAHLPIDETWNFFEASHGQLAAHKWLLF